MHGGFICRCVSTSETADYRSIECVLFHIRRLSFYRMCSLPHTPTIVRGSGLGVVYQTYTGLSDLHRARPPRRFFVAACKCGPQLVMQLGRAK